MSAIAPLPDTALPAPRRVEVRRDTMVVEGHALEDVTLAGYVLGPEVGTAPVVLIIGGITASPFPFGDAATGAEPWWPALQAPDLIDPSHHTVLAPCWPGNGSTWRGFDDGPLPPISALGLADLIAAWLDGIGCTAPILFAGASLGGLVGVALAVRHPDRVARLVTISAGLRPDGWGTATRHVQRELVRDGLRTGDVATATAGARASLWKLDSEYGHDAALADQARLAAILRDTGFITRPAPQARPRFSGVGAKPLREIRIGMIGCGTVGTGVLELLDRQRAALAERYSVRYRVTRIAVRDPSKPRSALAADIPRTTRALDLVADPDVDVIVEVAGGEEVATAVTAALAAGKPVVTANKALLAKQLAALGVLAQRTETPLLCEAAAAAAIPIIRHLSHRADEVDSLMGIVNGTCNFIITRLEQDELPMDRAIAEAQALGLAEADPSADLDGHDAAAKLSILAYRAFGTWVPPHELPVRGIGELWPADCDLAEAMGFRIRLIAHAARVGGGLAAGVEPVLLPDWHLLASVEEEYNAVYMRTASSGDLSLFGKGAGPLPTASAVLGDLIDLAQDNSVQWPPPREVSVAAPPPRRHYLRVSAETHPGLARRVDSIVRRAGLGVQNRAARGEVNVMHHGFLLSPSDDAAVERVVEQLRSLGRVEQILWLGVAE